LSQIDQVPTMHYCLDTTNIILLLLDQKGMTSRKVWKTYELKLSGRRTGRIMKVKLLSYVDNCYFLRNLIFSCVSSSLYLLRLIKSWFQQVKIVLRTCFCILSGFALFHIGVRALKNKTAHLCRRWEGQTTKIPMGEYTHRTIINV